MDEQTIYLVIKVGETTPAELCFTDAAASAAAIRRTGTSSYLYEVVPVKFYPPDPELPKYKYVGRQFWVWNESSKRPLQYHCSAAEEAGLTTRCCTLAIRVSVPLSVVTVSILTTMPSDSGSTSFASKRQRPSAALMNCSTCCMIEYGAIDE
jgi:hypothetical protein